MRVGSATFIAVAIIGSATLWRIWMLHRAWFYFDDLAFMSAGMNDPLSWDFVGRVYAGHVMPAGWLVIKGLATWAPYNWTVWGGLLLLMQTVASWGAYRLLRNLFGPTRLVWALLALYTVWIFTVPAGIWFAAGINQLPLQIAMTFGLSAHVNYLRNPQWRSLLLAVGWAIFGLAFYEKTALLFVLYLVLGLGWFSTGKLEARVSGLWTRYRTGLLVHGAVAVAYLAAYLKFGLGFASSQQPSATLMSQVAYNQIARAFSTGAIGGPFEWRYMSANALADPSDLISLGSWVALGSLAWYAANTRTISRRAWFVVGLPLLANVYLISSARATLIGPDIGLEYRYQTESALTLVLALGLAFLPLRGAPERNELRGDAVLTGERASVVQSVTAAVVVCAVISTLAYVQNWHTSNVTPSYYRNVVASLEKHPKAALIDASLPQNLIWAFGYPENTYSHMFRNLRSQATYPRVAVDSLYEFDDNGRITQVVIPPARQMIGGSGCGYILSEGPTSIPLDGPVVGGGWWIALPYAAPADFTGTVTLGDRSMKVNFPKGLHTVYLDAYGSYDHVTIDNSRAGATACITGLTLGVPVAPPIAS